MPSAKQLGPDLPHAHRPKANLRSAAVAITIVDVGMGADIPWH